MLTQPTRTRTGKAALVLLAVLVVIVAAIIAVILWPTSSGSNTDVAEGDSDMRTAVTSVTEPVAVNIASVGPVPQWIWARSAAEEPPQRCHLRRGFSVRTGLTQAMLTVTCDNAATVYCNGIEVAQTTDWWTPQIVDITDALSDPTLQHTLAIDALNEGGQFGALVSLSLTYDDGTTDRIITDESWEADIDEGFSNPAPVAMLGAHGVEPWGLLRAFPGMEPDRNLAVVPGFTVDLVYSVGPDEGSWVCITPDDDGTLIASDQRGSLYRLAPCGVDEDHLQSTVTLLAEDIGGAQGLLCIDQDLYCMVATEQADGPGLYHLQDLDDDGFYEQRSKLIDLNVGGEHGPHAVIEGPDGRVYLVAGNHTHLPEVDRSHVPQVWQEDTLLERLWDARGHAVGIHAPGGWICSMERDGSDLAVHCIGFRNTYDIAFHDDGSLFAYDSDMEWDLGAPWYRPTRLLHAVSGADFGWRSGSAKWREEEPDTLPAVVDMGPGSPTGVCFGYETNFPEPYRNALFALDWTFGTVHAIHLERDGASWRGRREPFLTGRPLPLADVAVHPHDGAMYVVLGGRGVQSAVYRIRASEPETKQRVEDAGVSAAAARRIAMEQLHHADTPGSAIDDIWNGLGDSDRHVSHAARVALEFQPVERWRDRLDAATGDQRTLLAMVAIARVGTDDDRSQLCAQLAMIDPSQLDSALQHIWARACTLSLARMDRSIWPDTSALRQQAESLYPSEDASLDRSLCELLVALDSPFVVNRTLALMERSDDNADSRSKWFDKALLQRNDTYGSVILKSAAASPMQQQMALAMSLRHATFGWTDDLRDRYFAWFAAARTMHGGLSFGGFLDRIRDDALAHVDEAQHERLIELSNAGMKPPGDGPSPVGPGRQWSVADIERLTAEGLRNRDFENGQRMYVAGSCAACHRFAGIGIGSGPDLTAVSTRFTIRDLAVALIEPSESVSDQYQLTEILQTNGDVALGRLISADDTSVRIMPSLLNPEVTSTIDRDDIVNLSPQTAISPMPANLLDAMNADEVLDLFAYLLSEGDARSPMFSDSTDP